MKYLVVSLVVVCSLVCSQEGIEAAAKKTTKRKAPRNSCAGKVLELAPLYFKKIWNQESIDPSFQKIEDLNGIVIWEVAEFCKRHKRLPVSTELIKKLRVHKSKAPTAGYSLLDEMEENFDSYFSQEGAPKDLDAVLANAVAELPEHFEILRSGARAKLMAFFKKKLRMPSLDELATELKVESKYLSAVMGEPATLIEQAKVEKASVFLDVQGKILKAFMRAVQQRDRPDHMKIQQNTPTLDEIFIALIRSESNREVMTSHLEGAFEKEHLAQLLGIDSVKVAGPKPLFPLPVLFPGGITELEQQARLQNPGAFRNYKSDIKFDMARADRALEAITQSDGFIITSATAGIPLVEEMYALMLHKADELGWPVIVVPTNQILEGLDERLLNDPRVHVLTNTITNSAIKIWQIPILAKNKNAFASLDQYGQFTPGQLVIVGHPQLAHRIVPTGSDHIRETAQWSPGSVSKALYPFRMPQQGRTSALASNYHRNSFLMVEKADRKAGSMSEGVRNSWHVRPVEYTDDRKHGGTAGFNDLGRRHSVVLDDQNKPTFTQTVYEPQALIVGDLHDYVADQRMISHYRNILQRFPSLRDVYIHDPIDGFSHNHHERERTTLLISKFRKGELDYHKEMMGLVQTTNAFLSIRPNIRVKFPDSNHSYWGRQLVDKKTETQSVVNGEFLAELTHAKVIHRVSDPLEWVFQHRNRYIASLPAHLQRTYDEHAVLVTDPQRVQIIPFGVPDTIGPDYRPVHLNFHGHQGANGAKGSPQSHARGSENSVVGDSHQSVILGGYMNIGTSTTKQVGYNNGGYSAWVNSFAVVYPDGTKQLLTYSSIAGTYSQRREFGVLPPADFFGDDPLEVKPTDNQLLPDTEVMDVHSWWINMLRGKVSAPH